MIQAVTLDVGNTLLHPWPSVGHIYAAEAVAHGYQAIDPRLLNQRFIEAWQTRHPFRHSEEEWATIVDATFHDLVSPPPSQTFFPTLYDRFTTADCWQLYADVIPTLERLQQHNLRLGIVSNWDHRLRNLLDNLDLTRFFDTVVVSCETPWVKPDPEIFQEAARGLALDPGVILHVGDDEQDDRLAAASAGFQARRIDRREPTSSDQVLASLEDLIAVVT